MKKILFVLLCCLLICGCSASPAETSAPTENLQIANPWKSYSSLAEAEAASGLAFPIPEVIADSYTAESFRVMNGQLLEVIYRDGEFEVTVRMQAGAEQDISGVYENFQHTETTEQNGAAITRKEATDCLVYLIHMNNHSISIYATSMAADDACREILSYIY